MAELEEMTKELEAKTYEIEQLKLKNEKLLDELTMSQNKLSAANEKAEQLEMQLKKLKQSSIGQGLKDGTQSEKGTIVNELESILELPDHDPDDGPLIQEVTHDDDGYPSLPQQIQDLEDMNKNLKKRLEETTDQLEKMKDHDEIIND